MVDILTKSFDALWQVAVAALLLGAGLPVLFALGTKALGVGRPVSPDGTSFAGPPTAAGRGVASVLFGICIAAVLFGIVVIVAGKQLFGT